MDNAWQRYLEMASGLTNVTRQRAERAVKGLVKQGEVAADQLERTVDELLKRSESNRNAMAGLVRSETERAVDRLGLARQRDLDRLAARVDKLEAKPSATKTATAAKKSAAAKRSAAGKASASPVAGTAATTSAASAGTGKKTTAGKRSTVADRAADPPASATGAASADAPETGGSPT